MKPVVSVIGLGYVGLTLAATLLARGFTVKGVEINKNVRETLDKKRIHISEPGIEEIIKRHLGDSLIITEDIPEGCDIYFVCVATPYDYENHRPQLDSLKSAISSLALKANDDALVVVRSTAPVGTTRHLLLPLLEQHLRSPLLAFAPERTIQGKAMEELSTLPQIVGANNNRSLQKAEEIFQQLGFQVISVSSLEVAELAKLVCNSYSDVLYAFGNEVASVAEEFGLNAYEVIEAANTDYPRTKIFSPGHVGGSCLTKDPYHLVHSLNEKSYVPRLITGARAINEELVEKIISKLDQELRNKEMINSNISVFLSGFAYKGVPETDDLRGSIIEKLIPLLRAKGLQHIKGHDFVVEDEVLKNYNVELTPFEEGVRSSQLVMILNNHRKYLQVDINKLVEEKNSSFILFDLWGVYREKMDLLKKNKHVAYLGVGFNG